MPPRRRKARTVPNESSVDVAAPNSMATRKGPVVADGGAREDTVVRRATRSMTSTATRDEQRSSNISGTRNVTQHAVAEKRARGTTDVRATRSTTTTATSEEQRSPNVQGGDATQPTAAEKRARDTSDVHKMTRSATSTATQEERKSPNVSGTRNAMPPVVVPHMTRDSTGVYRASIPPISAAVIEEPRTQDATRTRTGTEPVITEHGARDTTNVQRATTSRTFAVATEGRTAKNPVSTCKESTAAEKRTRGADAAQMGTKSTPSTTTTDVPIPDNIAVTCNANQSIAAENRVRQTTDVYKASRPTTIATAKEGRSINTAVTQPGAANAQTRPTSTLKPRPRPRPRTIPYEDDSDDGFNVRRVREQQRLRSLSVPTSDSGEVELHISEPEMQNELAEYQRDHMITGDVQETESGQWSAIDNEQDILPRAESVGEDPMVEPGHEMSIDEEQDLEPEMDGGSAEESRGMTRYDFLFPGGGGSRYYGVPPFRGEPTMASRRTLVFCRESKQWRRIPPGYCAPVRNPNDEQEAEDWENRTDFNEQAAEDWEQSSASDFSDDRRAMEKKRGKRREEGRDVSDTEIEDEQDDLELADSVVPESPERSRHHRMNKLQSEKSVNNNSRVLRLHPMDIKNMTMAENSYMDCTIDELGAGDDDKEQRGPVMGRRYSKREDEKIDELRTSTKETVRQIAEEFGRNHKGIMLRAGMSTKPTRKMNLSNVYKTWYGMTHDKDMDCSNSDWMKLMIAKYNKFMDDLDIDDYDSRRKRMEPIIEEVKSMQTASDIHLKEPTTRFKSVVKQLQELSTSIDMLDGDIQVMGLAIYTGSNRAAQNLSGLFTGSDVARVLLNQHKTRVQSIINIVTNKFRSAVDDKMMGVSSSKTSDGDGWGRMPSEKDREYFRRVLSGHLTPQLNAVTGKASAQISWKNILRLAYLYQFCLRNWSSYVYPSPGPHFNVEKLKGQDFKYLAQPIIDCAQDCISIIKWSDADLQLNFGESAYAEIPLVTDTSGVVLSRLKDCLEFQKHLAKDVKGKKRGEDIMPKREVRPLPSRVRTASPNPRPTKRPRETSWQGDGDGEMESTADFRDTGVNAGLLGPTQRLWTLDPLEEETDLVENPYPTRHVGRTGFNEVAMTRDGFHEMRSAGTSSRNRVPTDRVPSSTTRNEVVRKRMPVPSLCDLAQQQQAPPSARTLKTTASHAHPIQLSSQVASRAHEALPPKSKVSFQIPQVAHPSRVVSHDHFYNTHPPGRSTERRYGHYRQKEAHANAIAGPSRQPGGGQH